MKILNLKIKSPSDELIRDISFNESGISFIYGDIQEPMNKKATINSLGKTLLLKFIDYIFGANEDKKAIGEELNGYVLEAVVKHKNKQYRVKKSIGVESGIWIEDKMYPLTDYKIFFEIERSLYAKQNILNKKNTEISYRTTPNKNDVTACLQLLNLIDMVDDVEEIYKSQDRVADLKKQKAEIISYYGSWNVDEIDEEIYYVDKEVSRLKDEIKKISDKIRDIEVSEIQQNVVEDYAVKSRSLKELKREYEKKRLEIERLSEFIESSRKNDLSSEHVLLIFKRVNQEVPDMVKRELKEVEDFHQKVYEERAAFLGEKKKEIELDMKKIKSELEELSEKVDSIGRVIATNEVYQECIELYGKYNSDLQGLMYRQGKLSQIKNVDNSIEEAGNKLTEHFGNVSQTRKLYEVLVAEYRDFIYSLIQTIYDKEVVSYFDIKVRKKHMTARPISFEFNIKGDTGEGVGEVKKNLMDYLICRYNTVLEVLMQDSACYNGIDPRQVAGMLNVLGEVAERTSKQVIIAINKYQVMGYDESIEYISDNSVLTLSENDKLLKFDF